MAISLAQDERGFALYTFYNPGGGKYLHHKGRDPSSVAKQLLSEVDNDSDDGKASIFPHLAIPSSKAFEALHQIHSKFTDVGDVVEVRTQNEQEAEEQREVHSERHRHRLFARMMNRSLSQYYEHIKLDEKDQEQEKKTDDDSSAPAQSAPVHLQEAARSKINIPPPINTSNLTSAGSKREEERFITKIFAVLPLPGIVIKAKIVSGNEENHSPRKSFTEHADFPSALPQRRRSSTNSNFDDGPRGSDADDGDGGSDQQKVFVNVFHHKALDEMMLSERIRLPQVHVAVVGFGEVTEVRDKKGKSTPCYNIIVPSSSFVKSDHHAHLPIYSNAQLVYLLEQVNSHFSINLSTRDFVLPKVKAGFKGNPFIEPECFICKLDKSWMQSVSAPATPRSRTGSLIGEILHQIRPGHVTPRSDGSSFPTEVAPGNRSRLSSRDLESVVSDTGSHQNHGTPTAAAAAASRRKTLRSSITETLHLTPSDEGSRLLSVNMMIYTEDGSLTLAEVQAMKHQSVDEPAVLLGWQILLFQNFKRGKNF